MIIESLQLFYHLSCFCCYVCGVTLGTGAQGADVRVRNGRLHCQSCYSNDEGELSDHLRIFGFSSYFKPFSAGLKFSQV